DQSLHDSKHHKHHIMHTQQMLAPEYRIEPRLQRSVVQNRTSLNCMLHPNQTIDASPPEYSSLIFKMNLT
ncbi:hypothetical protein RA272_28560, partial [Pseudomonas syringae pv. tagetis]|uniref:hypothetical protein n=1 Tax=Pseudomonas syringae group genomosp. 7 TaxID=251699 RepID=UPI00376F6FBE